MTNYIKWLGAWMLLAVPVAGLAAEGLSYNYVQAGYVNIDIDDFDEDADGFGVNASGLLSENIFVFASYADVETDTFPSGGAQVDVEEQTITAGVGYRMPLQSGTDLNASVAFVDDELEVSASGLGGSASLSEDDTGFGLSLGLRHLFTPQFEGGAGISYVDIYDDSETSFSLSGLFHVTSVLSLGAGYTFGSDADVLTLGGRLNF